MVVRSALERVTMLAYPKDAPPRGRLRTMASVLTGCQTWAQYP